MPPVHKTLLRRHAVGTCLGGEVLEAAAIHREAAQRVQHADTILDEPTVLGRVNAQCSQRNDDLRAGFAVGCAQLVNPPSFCCTELSQLSPLSTAFFALLLLL